MPLTARKMDLRARDIIEIDEGLCDGCGLCVLGCAEGALEIVDGKARLVSDSYCDGLGACLGECPRGALRITRRQSEGFDEEAALRALAARRGAAGAPVLAARAPAPAAELHAPAPSVTPCGGKDGGPGLPGDGEGGSGGGGRHGGHGGGETPAAHGGCPGARARALPGASQAMPGNGAAEPSGLANWPVQMMLIPPQAPFLEAASVTVAADCTAFACPGFHREFLGGGAPLLVGCPKLDDVDAYIIKISEILKAHPGIRELRVPIMEVPCCRGLAYAAVRGAERSGRAGVDLKVLVVGLDGSVAEEAPEGPDAGEGE
jgi:Pyruvate/2-oxoacid:ferredoxin oxidoreductase delta subunit